MSAWDPCSTRYTSSSQKSRSAQSSTDYKKVSSVLIPVSSLEILHFFNGRFKGDCPPLAVGGVLINAKREGLYPMFCTATPASSWHLQQTAACEVAFQSKANLDKRCFSTKNCL